MNTTHSIQMNHIQNPLSKHEISTLKFNNRIHKQFYKHNQNHDHNQQQSRCQHFI